MKVYTFCLSFICVFPAALVWPKSLELRAYKTASSPIIDGLLNDSCWHYCKPATDFFMVEPTPGAPVTQKTFVYVCYDDEEIYFGAYMFESEIDRIQSTINQRDGPVFKDDAFEVIIDTYCDRCNAYYFMANLLGTKLDGRIIDEGRNMDQAWDAQWETKAKLVKDGWQMEIAIPFSELSFSNKDTLIWGINFWRTERPHWENSSWAPIQNFTQVSKFGTLVGLSIKPKTKRFEVLPYVASRYEYDTLKPKAGIDFAYDITSNFNFSITYLPDFAHIEADPLRFNLSYQQGEELYFLEKRPFFRKGSGVLVTPLQLFYSRRINEIYGGIKAYGTIKSTEVLGLNVQTRDTIRNFSVLRFKQSFFNANTIGILATHMQAGDTISQGSGIDLNLSPYGPLLITSQVAGTNNTGKSGDRWAGYLGIKGETGSYSANIYAYRLGSGFLVKQGFLNTYDIGKQHACGEGWYKFLQNWGIFQWISAGAYFNFSDEIEKIDKGLVRAREMLYLNFVTTSKYRFGIYGRHYYEEYGMDVFINKTIEFQIENNVGGFSGILSSLRLGRMYNKLFRLWTMELIFLPHKEITVWPYFQVIHWGETKWRWLTNISISYKITDKAFFRIYFQSESDAQTPSSEALVFEEIKNLNNNFLFGYEFAPRTMLYLVYNIQRTFEPKMTNHIFMIKFTYSFRF